MSARSTRALWDGLTAYSDTYTCYSAAVATWAAWARQDWEQLVDPGLWLQLVPRDDLLFGFGHFPPDLRRRLGLVRRGSAEAEEARLGVEAELRRSGRVIVTGDGYHLPWHVAFRRRHVPHWYVIVDAPEGATALDPFACRTELGVQEAHRRVLAGQPLESLLVGLPGDDPVLTLRESMALGELGEISEGQDYGWFEAAPVDQLSIPEGPLGPDAVARLATHFRSHGQKPAAYAQAQDIWSIARHRAFLCRHLEARARAHDERHVQEWLAEHGSALVRRWSHLAPLLMQATLTLSAGRTATDSVPQALEALAAMERAAAAAYPPAFATGSVSPASESSSI